MKLVNVENKQELINESVL